MFRKLLWGFALCITVSAAQAGDPSKIPVEAFFEHAKFYLATLSPDGRTLAVVGTGKTESQGVLAFIDLASMKPVGSFNLVGEQSIARLSWVSDKRVVFTTATQTGTLDQPVLTGDIWAINSDGSGVKTLAFHQAEGMAYRGYYNELLYVSPDNPKFVVIAQYESSSNPIVYRVDLRTGDKKQVLTSPLTNGRLIADNNGEVRIVSGFNTKTVKAVMMYRDAGSNDWRDVSDLVLQEPDYTSYGPVDFTADNQKFYFRGNTPDGKLGLYIVDPAAGMKKTLVYGDPDYDIANQFAPTYYLYAHDHKTLVAFQYNTDTPSWILLDKNAVESQALADVSSAFEGENVIMTSIDDAADRAVFHVSSDRDPGGFYLYDLKQKQMTPLFTSRPGIDSADMASMKPIEFAARDGLKVHGYLTLPLGKEKNLPLIIHPHGGPFTIRDTWGFDSDVQFLASRGYAVLQVNYRGSGGYGATFQQAGYRQWGGKMQDDLTDATKWAIQQGVADPNRVCIYGGSYGGYASLEGVVKEPDLYKCAVGYAGVYDLLMMRGEANTLARQTLEPFMKKTVGDDEAVLKANSPAFNVGRIKAALLLAHGGQDKTVVIDHADELKGALDKIGKQYIWIYYPNEAHGFYTPEHNTALYTQMQAFFDKYIGPDASKSVPATETKGN